MYDHWKTLLQELDYNQRNTIIDIGGAYDPVPVATATVDVYNLGKGGGKYHLLDVTWQRLPFPDKSFDIAICCQTLEDLTCPTLILHEMERVAKRGIIEVPHRGAESIKIHHSDTVWSYGSGHHRWLIDEYNDKLRFAPKRYDLLMENPIPKWNGPSGVHWVWHDKIDFFVELDVRVTDARKSYAAFREDNRKYWT